jgi:hypothetical protein
MKISYSFHCGGAFEYEYQTESTLSSNFWFNDRRCGRIRASVPIFKGHGAWRMLVRGTTVQQWC